MIHSVLNYFRAHQPPKIRILHFIVLFAVISQILVSNFIGFSGSGEIASNAPQFYGTWIHIITGVILLPVALFFTALVIREKGVRYFYPYLFGNFDQIKSDITQLRQLELPEPKAGGLAATVIGLGLGALFLAICTGLLWFFSWEAGKEWSYAVMNFHGGIVGLIELYLVGHGGMGLLHIYLSTRSSTKEKV